MKNTAKQFSQNGKNLGMFGYVIGALDGWLVKTKWPTNKRGGAANVGGYHCRKGRDMPQMHRPLSIAIKLWSSIPSNTETVITSKEVSHDKHWSKKLNFDFSRLVFLGDSTHALHPFLLIHYENVKHRALEDESDRHLSANRICVECAFGEINYRWGVF